jgi:hypothetical protein
MIIIEPLGGLANRMRVIASGIWLKDQLKTILIVVWNENDELNCPFEKLFDPIQGVMVTNKPSKYGHLRRTNQPKSFARLKANIINKLFGINYCIQELDFHELIWQGKLDILGIASQNKTVYIQTCQEFGDNLYAFKHFKPISPMLAAIRKATANFNEHTIGVHIRRTDNINSVQHSPLSLFIKAMQHAINLQQNTLFYLSSDDPEVKAALIDTFGQRIITHTNKMDRRSTQGMQDALLDIYCLAATNKIFGSYWSSFSDIAARIKGIELEVMKSKA